MSFVVVCLAGPAAGGLLTLWLLLMLLSASVFMDLLLWCTEMGRWARPDRFDVERTPDTVVLLAGGWWSASPSESVPSGSTSSERTACRLLVLLCAERMKAEGEMRPRGLTMSRGEVRLRCSLRGSISSSSTAICWSSLLVLPLLWMLLPPEPAQATCSVHVVSQGFGRQGGQAGMVEVVVERRPAR